MSHKQGRKIKVPAESRRVASVTSTVVSQLKFLTLSDSINLLADQIDVGAPTDLVLSVNDSFSLNDALSLSLELSTGVSDSLSLTDSIELNEAYRTNLSDSIDLLSDSISLEFEVRLPLADFLPALTEAIESYELGHHLVTLADSANSTTDSLALGYGLASSDQFLLTDGFETFGQFFLTTQDSIDNWLEFFIAVPQGVDYTFERGDALSQSDSISLFSAGFTEFADSFTLTDAYSQQANGLQTFSDALTQSDAAVLQSNGLTTLADSAIQPVDGTVVTGTVWDIGVTGEQLTQSDAVSLSMDSSVRQIVASDSFTLTDSVDLKRGPTRWNDAISVSTAVSSQLTQNLSDSLPAMTEEFIQKKPRWRDAISVVKSNTSNIPITLSDTNSSMSDAVSTSRIQIGQPVSDISVGLWSATPLWQKIDEFAASDADLINSATNPANDTCEVGLRTSITDPVSSSNHIVSYRYAKSASGGRQIDLTVRLMQGTTIIATFTHTNITNTVTQADQTLTGPQADSITNYGDLRLRFIGNVVGSGSGRAARITWGQFRCPK